MNLAVDCGNTLLKAGIFDNNKLIETISGVSVKELVTLTESYPIAHTIISSVGKLSEELKEALEHFNPVMLNYTTPHKLKVHYATPHTLGMDRLAAVAGAHELYPQQSILVIDAGSCITYDIVDGHGNYCGGNITPGLRMKLKALNTFTAKLPLIELHNPESFVGVDTASSILSGVVFGSVSEVEGIISLYRKKFGNLQVILCGGDAAFFESKIKQHIFVVPQLVLIGLNSILEHNVSKK
jgi:type III pantothenate kinase